MANKLTRCLLAIYLLVLVWILLFKLGVHFSYMHNRKVNLIPFSDLFLKGTIDVAEVILNVLIFVPLGVYIGVLYKRWTFLTKISFIFLLSLGFESIQFIARIGAFDITDDLVTNTIGGIVGLLGFAGLEKIVNNRDKAQKFINILATIGTVSIIVLLFMLKMNKLPIRYQ